MMGQTWTEGNEGSVGRLSRQKILTVQGMATLATNTWVSQAMGTAGDGSPQGKRARSGE